MTPRKLGILPGSFNPPTLAHIELANAGSRVVDEVLFIVPSVLPHKEYSGASLEQRLAMLESAGFEMPHSIATTDCGLYIDIGRDCREYYDSRATLSFLCGRDAAERILNWDYGQPGVVEELLQEFELLVAPRAGAFEPPVEFRDRVRLLDIAEGHDEVSSSEVRSRISHGDRWEHLVPPGIIEQIRKIYS